ncbi:MAG: GNAT family N-acetyltransferase [Halieaceae bacterium]|nr:GNAT family N-acetyltransferase [Halieaceae bacterium]
MRRDVRLATQPGLPVYRSTGLLVYWSTGLPIYWRLLSKFSLSMDTKSSLFIGSLVRLGAYTHEDAPDFARWTENDEYMRLMDTDIIRPLSVDRVKEHAQKYWMGEDSYHFTLRTLSDGRLIGFVSLHELE